MHSFKVSHPKVGAKNAIISTHAKHGEFRKALEVFYGMLHDAMQPDTATFLSLLKSPTNSNDAYLPYCRLLHNQIIRYDFDSNKMVCNAIVHAYASSGSLNEAHKVLERSRSRDVLTWGSIMFAHFQQGQGFYVLELFSKMQEEGIIPDKFIYVCVFKACSLSRALREGIAVHAEIVKRGITLDTSIGYVLVDMYSKNKSLDDAFKVFCDMQVHDVVSWGALIGGFSLQGKGCRVFELFEELQCKGICPNNVVLLFVIKACADMRLLEGGMLLHDQAIRISMESDLALGSAFVGFYSSCREVVEARNVFDHLPNKDVVAWGAMIGAYAQSGQDISALILFAQLQEVGAKPSNATFSSMFKVCGVMRNFEAGKLLHHQFVEDELESNDVVVSALADMYAKWGSLMEAQNVFQISSQQDIVSWGAMIARYAAEGQNFYALDLFLEMQEEGVNPGKTIYLSILKVCSNLEILFWGILVHIQVIENELEADVVVGNGLINLYTKFGCLDDAKKLFDQLVDRDSVSWNTLVAGYTSHGYDASALKFVEEMHARGVEPSKATYSSILKVCGNIGAMIHGKATHDRIIKDGLHNDTIVGSALVDMYAKCGCLQDAQKVFEELPQKDVVSWGSITAGYALHGNPLMARHCFLDMQRQGLQLSEGVFTNMLVAFTHTGLLKEGCELFSSVSSCHSEFLNAEHYSCIIDLLGRAGQLYDAGCFLQSMPNRPCMPNRRSLLTSCRTHGNLGLGMHCFHQGADVDTLIACG